MRHKVLLRFIKVFLAVLCFFSIHIAQADITITATVGGYCGNNVLEPGEQCESTDLGGMSCSSFNFNRGTLTCSPLCTFDISQCSTYVPPGGGGGGGGGAPSTENTATVVFSGQAFPNSSISILRDGITSGTTVAGPDAKFQISLSGLSIGNYSFSLVAKDKDNLKSQTQSFAVGLSTGITTSVTGIFFAPTLAADKTQVKQGDTISFFGQTTPSASVSLVVHSDTATYATTSSDSKGIYFYQFDTTPLEMGLHQANSKASSQLSVSSLSAALSFIVGNESLLVKKDLKTETCAVGDLNCDKNVNIVDFSVLAYWYHRNSFPKDIDLNNDGKIDLVDFSIMAYHWTG
jgi:hypothetical protein